MEKCPNCGKTLHLWNMRAECPACKANIPNHNWEERLEEDALEREKAFYKMHSTLNKLKFSVVGSKFRIARLALAFLPILGYVVPLGSLNYTCADGTVFAADSVNAIAFFTNDSLKFTDILGKVTGGFDIHNNVMMAFVLLVLSLLFGVLAFFSIPVIFSKFKQPVTAILHCLSIVAYAAAAFEFNARGGDITKLGWGVIVGLVLFAAAFVVDIIVLCGKIKPTDGKYIPDANKDLLRAEYAESIGERFVALKEQKAEATDTAESNEKEEN